MRIGIDATSVSSSEGTGMQSYSFNLTKNLLELDQKNEYIIYCRKEIPEAFRPFVGKAEFRICKLPKRKLCEQLWLPLVSPFDSLDVLHCICSLPPVVSSRVSVLTVHGLSWRIFPEVFTTALRWYWILTAERTMKKASRLIAISHWTKNVVSKHVGIPKDRLDVVHHGVNLDVFHPITDDRKIKQLKTRYSLPDHFILFVGSLLPVKNIPTLIRAFNELIQRTEFKHYHLVIAGGRGWGYQPVYDLVTHLGLEDRIIFTGFFPAEDLPTLYSAAEVFVLPSLYEGFGIPIIESFACGTPVITSNASCLPEVAGDAALLFNPQDTTDLVEAMTKVLSDSMLRETIIAKGLEKAKEFSWKKTAEKTLKVYIKAYTMVNFSDMRCFSLCSLIFGDFFL